MFKTDSFSGNKKSSLNQNVWHDHATMQHRFTGYFVAFLGNISMLNQAEI